MIIKIDDKTIEYDMAILGDKLENTYKNNPSLKFKLNGKEIDFSPKSMGRLMLNPIINFLIIPMIEDLYRKEGLQARKLNRHEEPLSYCVELIAEYLRIAFKNERITIETKEYGNVNKVVSLKVNLVKQEVESGTVENVAQGC